MNEKVRELMALADKYAEAKAQVAVYGFSDVQKRRAALEQAIRRAVDLGNPIAFWEGPWGQLRANQDDLLPEKPKWNFRIPLYARRKDQ